MRLVIVEKTSRPLSDRQFDAFLTRIGGIIGHNGFIITSRDSFPIGNGWLRILRDLICELMAVGWNREMDYIKEKLGGLRFGTNELSEEGRKILFLYENSSFETCEECGRHGEPRHMNWIRTLCDNHYQEREDSINNYPNDFGDET